LGGRPRKFKNEAEKKRFYRQQKKLQTIGESLRKYRSYKERTRTIEKFSQIDPNNISGKYNCPKCGRFHKIDKSRSGYIGEDYYRFREGLVYNQELITCESCGYQYPVISKRIQTTIYRAGSSTERSQRSKEKKEDEEEDEEDEE
jgi:predicted RNA-binding Zn-ribbon protein involved in translation (DUF1610 family)